MNTKHTANSNGRANIQRILNGPQVHQAQLRRKLCIVHRHGVDIPIPRRLQSSSGGNTHSPAEGPISAKGKQKDMREAVVKLAQLENIQTSTKVTITATNIKDKKSRMAVALKKTTTKIRKCQPVASVTAVLQKDTFSCSHRITRKFQIHNNENFHEHF